jgi:hypothetical protein
MAIAIGLMAACSAQPPAPATPPERPVVRPARPAVPPPAATYDELAPTAVVATLDGKPIVLRDVTRYIDSGTREQIDAIADAKTRAWRLRDAQLKALEALMEDRLLQAEATRRGIEIADAEVDAAIREVISANQISEQELAKALGDAGYTMAEYAEDVRQQILWQRLIAMESANTGEDKAKVRARLLEKLRPGAVVELKIGHLPKPPPAPPAVVLDTSTLLAEADIVGAVGGGGPFTVKPLAGEPATADYAGVHFQATDKTEKHDLAYRVWRLTTDGAIAKYDELRANLPGSKIVDQVGDSSLEASQDGIHGHGFLMRVPGVVVLVTCGQDLCKTPADVLSIARLIHGRVDQLKTIKAP